MFGSDGTESRAFHIQDGLGIVAAAGVGLETIWISGRDSSVVRRRAEELRVRRLMQGVRDKRSAVITVCAELGAESEEVAFVGDDINDIPGMRACGIALCPKDAASDVIGSADWVLTRLGGRGAVREAIELILRSQEKWDKARETYLSEITGESRTPDRRRSIQ